MSGQNCREQSLAREPETRSLAVDPEYGSNGSLSLSDSLNFPEGGREAWLVVLGGSLALFSTTGINNAYGVFQAYYKDHLLSKSSSSAISLIGAVQIALVYGGGPIVGKVFDAHGLKLLLPLGSFLVVLSLMLISVCQQDQLYQFFLVQGVISGVGNAMIFTPTVAVIAHWFQRRRAYAMGIVVAGSSFGGVVYSIMLQHLQVKVGFPWAVRIAGFVTLGCLIVALSTIKTRLPPAGKVSLLQVVDLHGFHDVRYTLITLSSFLYFYALFIPYFYVQEYADFQGVSPAISPYLLAIINGCGIPARIIPGLLGDRFGVLQVLLPSTILSGVIVLAMWLPSRGSVPIVLFSALYGVFASCFISLLPAYVALITPVENFGARLGSMYIFAAISCLVGTPTAGAFVPSFTQEHFNRLFTFTGVLLLTSAMLIGLARVISIQRRRPFEEEKKVLPSEPLASASNPEMDEIGFGHSGLRGTSPINNISKNINRRISLVNSTI